MGSTLSPLLLCSPRLQGLRTPRAPSGRKMLRTRKWQTAPLRHRCLKLTPMAWLLVLLPSPWASIPPTNVAKATSHQRYSAQGQTKFPLALAIRSTALIPWIASHNNGTSNTHSKVRSPKASRRNRPLAAHHGLPRHRGTKADPTRRCAQFPASCCTRTTSNKRTTGSTARLMRTWESGARFQAVSNIWRFGNSFSFDLVGLE